MKGQKNDVNAESRWAGNNPVRPLEIRIMMKNHLDKDIEKDVRDYVISSQEYTRWKEYSDEESAAFAYVLPRWLNVEIALDDNSFYKRNNYPLWLYFRNGYGEEKEWLPVLANDSLCKLPTMNMDLHISTTDFVAIYMFAKNFKEELEQLADGEIAISEFYEIIDEKLGSRY